MKILQSHREWEDKLWNEMLSHISKINSDLVLNQFLSTIISKKERRIIMKRLAIVLMLKEGKTYNEIGQALWVSPSTIRAVRKSLLDEKGYITRWDSYLNQKENKARERSPKAPMRIADSRLLTLLDTILSGKTNMRARYGFLRK